MAKQYQWRTTLSIISGGYPGEEIGIIDGDQNWHTTSVLSGSITSSYFWRDSDQVRNEDSTRVVMNVTDKWQVSFDYKNNMTVKVNTVINSIVRDDLRGNPGTNTRHIYVKQEENGSVYFELANDPINSNRTLRDTAITLPQLTFVLPPGQGASRSSLWVRNSVSGHEADPLPNIFTDVLGAGVHFMNILPADYRPGATLRADEQWMPVTGEYISHNRLNGACHIYNGSGWQECRTVGGDTGDKGNAPLILTADNDSSWRNQKLIGLEQ